MALPTNIGLGLRGTTTLSIMRSSIKGMYVTLSINDTEHNNALHYAECRVLFIMLSVVAPLKKLAKDKLYFVTPVTKRKVLRH